MSSSEDRLTTLPDTILTHILSFLPTKTAAATAVLSKQWTTLWLTLPTLNFHDQSFKNFNSFLNFLSYVFLTRDPALPLHSFHLTCSNYHGTHYDYINTFLFAAAQRRGLENFILEMSNEMQWKINLPISIFSCRTLIVLNLKMVSVSNLSNVVVDFPVIKSICLSFVNVKFVQDFSKIILGCRVLEELQIKVLRAVKPCELVLVEYFRCLPNFIRANVSDLSNLGNVLFPLLSRPEVLCEDAELKETGLLHLPTFQNLTHIELILKHQRCAKWVRREVIFEQEHCQNWKSVIKVLKLCHKLQSLTIEYSGIEEETDVKAEDNWMDEATIPECLSTHLKTCLLKDYRNMEYERQFAKYILQNSKVLNTMSIKTAFPRDIHLKYKTIQELAWLTMASSSCKLLFDNQSYSVPGCSII